MSLTQVSILTRPVSRVQPHTRFFYLFTANLLNHGKV